ncbi:MAG TPA: trehalase-like domain-containing protein, partial [Paracoccaceae bacterium]|nr:trehalase-like domain-containing protein [Paracoccaceae bacterium]
MTLGIIGNCAIAGLVDEAGSLNWLCLPRFDGEPVFHALLGHGPGTPGDGAFSVELADLTATVQKYEDNTAVLRTELHGASGAVEITDFAPRFEAQGRTFRPQMVIRRIR